MTPPTLFRLAGIALLMGLFPSGLMAAAPVEIADLFPADTLAYAEVTNPAELSPQLAAVFKGTLLEDSIPLIHKQKDSASSFFELNGKRELAGLGLLVSPEMMSEFKKLRLAIGLTGFSKTGQPEIALVVLTGDSPAAGLAARAFLTMTSNLRKVSEVSKVPLFQYRNPQISYDPNGMPLLSNDKPPQESPSELTFAYTPGLFVVGTGKAAMAHTIKRFLGEEKSGLADTSLFKELAAVHRETGIFYLVNFPVFAAKFDAANKFRGGMSEPDAYAWFTMVANAKAIQSIAGSVRFRNGDLTATASISMDPKQKSPLREFVSGSDVKVELLQHARKPALMAFAVTLPEKNRGASVINLFDAIAKSTGELGRLPSDVVKEIETRHKLSISEGLLAKTKAITVVVPTRQELPKGASSLPMLTIQAEDEAAAGMWEEFLPKLFGEIAGEAAVPQTSSESIGGIKVFSLPGKGLPWNAPVHFARNGRAVSLGLDRKLVAASLNPDAGSQMVTAESLFTARKGQSLVGILTPAAILTALLERNSESEVKPEESPRFMPNGNPVPAKLIEEAKKTRTEFLTALAALPPTMFTVRSSGNELVIELVQPKVQSGSLTKAINSGVLWLDKWSGLSSASRQFQFGVDGGIER